MSSEKLTTVYGAAGTLEASYNAGGAITLGTDGILLSEPATLARSYVRGGERPPAPGGMGMIQRGAPGGPIATVPLPLQFRGGGAAYSASVWSDIHNLMRMSGHTATLDATPAAESHTYAPEAWDGSIPPAFASGVFSLYGRGELVPLQGAYATMSMEVEAGGPAEFTFEVSGIPGVTTEVTLPAISYVNPTIVPKADALAFTLGTYTAGKVRSISFAQGREIAGRSIYGFAAGRRSPTLTVTLEKPALEATTPFHTATTLHAEELWANSTALACSFRVGAAGAPGQYERLNFSAPAVTVVNVEDSEDGPVALQVLTLECAQSDAVTPDDYSFVTD